MTKEITSEQSLKYIIYARKSTDDTNDHSPLLDTQYKFAKEIAKQNNYKVIKTFRESASARKAHNRPKFDEMVKMIEDGKANAILCWHTSCLARNPLENGIIQQLLFDHKIKVIRTNDQKIYYPEDYFSLPDITMRMATEYSKKLSEVIKRGIRLKNKQGKPSCMAPQGYLNSRDKNNQPIIIPDLKRFYIIKNAFKLYLTGCYSVPELLSYINNDNHYLTKKRQRIGGHPLRLTTLHQMLKNPFYMGKIRDLDDPNVMHDGAWEPMITEREFEKIQMILKASSKKPNGKTS
ncbi:recombinase family protein [Candidatus Saccharibacteria bacterium]|nr:recombinase family protein [Candidatus Saccharibacteria bacterium]